MGSDKERLAAVLKPRYRIFAYQSLAYLFFDRAIFTIFLLERGMSVAMIGGLQTALWVATALAEVPMGHLGDRIGRVRIIILGRLLIMGYFACMAFGAGMAAYWCAFVLFGIGEACVSGSDTALLYEVTREEVGKRFDFAREVGRFGAVTTAALAVAMGVGGVLQDISWTVVYSCSLLAHALAIGVLVTVPEPRKLQPEDSRAAGSHLRDLVTYVRGAAREQHFVTFLMGVCVFEAAFVTLLILAPVLLRLRGAPEDIVAPLMTVVTVSSGLMAAQAWRAQRVLGVRRLFAGIPPLVALITMFMGGVAWWVASALLVTSAMLAPLLSPVLMRLLNDRLPDSLRAGALSLYSLVFSVCAMAMFPVVGAVADVAGANAAIVLLGLIGGVAGVVTAWPPASLSCGLEDAAL